MGATRLPMRKLRDVLRLKFDRGLPHRAIARACGIGQGTVSVYVQRARQAGLTWPLPDDLDDAQLEARLFPVPLEYRDGINGRACASDYVQRIDGQHVR